MQQKACHNTPLRPRVHLSVMFPEPPVGGGDTDAPLMAEPSQWPIFSPLNGYESAIKIFSDHGRQKHTSMDTKGNYHFLSPSIYHLLLAF